MPPRSRTRSSRCLGDVLYTGIVARAVVSVRLGDHRSLWEIARTLPYLRLAVADVLLAVIVGIGIVALIIPGLSSWRGSR